jgi:PAS domain S-box-containing protein
MQKVRRRPKDDLVQYETARANSDDGETDRGSSPLRRDAMRRSFARFRSGIGWRLLIHVLLFSSAITLLQTLTQLYFDYRRDVRAIDLRMSDIDSGYHRSLADGLWRLDARQLQLQVDEILVLPDIRYVELRETTDRAAPLAITAGSPQASPPARHEFRISYTNHGAEQLLGILVIEATFDRIYRQLLDTAAVILVSQGIKTFIVSFFILFIVHRLITRHLTAIATSLRGYDLYGSQAPLRLERRAPRPADELDSLVGAFNQMYARLQAAYADLREREARIRRLFDANIIGIFIADREGRILEANDAFLRVLGYGREDLVLGRVSLVELTPPEWHEFDKRVWAELNLTGIVQPFEKEYFRSDGRRIPVLVGVALFKKGGNEAVAFVLDLTERKQAEEAIRKLESDFAHINRVSVMGEMAASLSHEILQPIASARNNAHAARNFLKMRPPDLDETREALASIIADADRARDIIDRIREQMKKAPPRKELFDLNAAIEETIVLARSVTLGNGVSVQIRLAQGLLPVLGDRIQIQQVLLNLVLNAAEAMGSVEGARELLICTEQSQAGALVAVRDSGPGIDPAYFDRVFDAFYTTKSSGTGMGLSICRSIIRAHGGKLWAEANEPRGTVFQFTLPAGETELRTRSRRS